MEQLVRGDPFGLALELERLDRFDLDGVANQLVGRLADQHLAGGRGLLQPSGHVHGVAGDQPLAGRDVAGDDLARIHTGAVLQADPVVRLQALVDDLEGLAHLGGRPDRAQRVVLVEPWEPEDGHDGVSDVLLDRAAVADEDRAHGLEVDSEDGAERLAIEPFPERGRALQVAEDDRDDPSVLLRRRFGLQ